MEGTLQIRDFFYAGYENYCLRNFETASKEERKEAEEYIYQIYMRRNEKEALLGLKKSPNENLQWLYRYYQHYYLKEKKAKGGVAMEAEALLSEVEKLKITSPNGNILKSRLLFDCNKLQECFELLADGPIEVTSAKIVLLLLINRHDLVSQMIEEYKRLNDEIPIVKIMLAIFYLYNEIHKEAFLIFDDLESMCGSIVNDVSTVILNGKGVSNILNYEFNDAKEFLKNALREDPTNGDVLYNLITCSLYLYELDEASDFLDKLYDSFPSHESLTVLKKIDDAVDNFVAQF
ncbi:coatomer epsilon subunit [Plasmodium cynomolgi strain B]|uniref:Coatomer epsilon subunit n=1 Tax=Plasmodium cynomolgi (strain B) TaxID=1120755 RepID=K6URH9_PLACD|nr:coatomer epsilon subunit [Plasmodium cynomolgi strain B]GAB64455.1 coatomer epsilon subunit [Plasmodium cynomolgi strain B]